MAVVQKVDVELKSQTAVQGAGSAIAEGMTRYRWTICGLMFFITTFNYMDRQVLALLLPILQDPVKGIGLTQVQYGVIVSIFACAYAVGLLLAGGIVDRIGTKKGYLLAVAVWGCAALGHFFVALPGVANRVAAAAQFVSGGLLHLPLLGNAGWVKGIGTLSGAVIGFAVVRFALGLGEAGNFPAAVKTTAEWFPKKERSFATGIFNAGTNVGPILMPFLVGYVVVHFPWRYAFLVTIPFTVAWVVLWIRMYTPPAQNPHVSPAELAYINSDPPEPQTKKIAWARLITYRQTWAFLLGKFFTDPVWWFYLFWLPGYLYNRYGLSITKMGLPLLIIYNVCNVGSIFGGWLPTRFVSRGWSQNRARKTALLIYAVAVTPIMFISHAPNIWVAIVMIGIATALHQAWSCNLFTLPSDMFPKRAVASVTGIGAFGGALAVMFFGTFVGFLLKLTHNNYAPVFVIAGTAYLVAILVIQLLVPTLKPIEVE